MPGLLLQLEEQVEDAGLHRDVERARRLVGDDEVGVGRDRHRDEHALEHAARELVRVGVELLRGVADVDLLHERQGARLRLSLAEVGVLDAHGLGHLPADGADRVEGRHRVLRDERDGASAQLVDDLAGARDVLARDARLAGDDREVVWQQAQDGHRRRRLARAGLADDRHRLALVDVEADAVDGAHDAGAGQQLDLQVRDLEDSHVWSPFARRTRSRRPSPTRLTPTTSSAMARPGTVTSQGLPVTKSSRPSEMMPPHVG